MLKNFSLFQTILLSAFGAFAVAGMIIFSVVVGGQQGATIGEVVIWGTLDQAAFTAVLRQLSEEDTRYRSVSYVQIDETNYEKTLTDALASAQGPDLFIMSHDYAQKHASKIWSIPFETLSREQFSATFIDGAESFVANDGVLAVPLSVDPMVLYWNRDSLASAGFAKPPQYWDELFAFGSEATRRSQTNAIERSGVALGEYRNVEHAKDIVTLLMLQAGARITVRNTAGDLTPALIARAGDAQAPTESALRFYTDFANPIKTHYSWNRSLPSSQRAFGSGTLALYLGYASEEPLIRRINPNLNFAVAPTPQIRDEARLMNAGRVYGMAVPKASKNAQGALTIAFLLAGATPSAQLSKALGMPSARREVLAQPATGLDDLVNKQAILVRTWVDPSPEETEVIFRDMIESVTSGAAKLSEALQRADRALGEAIRQ
jgi:ABC-type glycerol-3-phosphate transport system substrate-binding protein